MIRESEIMDLALSGDLAIDLDAIAANWRALDALSAAAVETAAVVKADAYGCGAAQVGPALARAGARTFFVALPDEGASLRHTLGPGPTIYILGGYAPASPLHTTQSPPPSGGTVREGVQIEADHHLYPTHNLRPVLNSAAQAAAWFRNHPDAVGYDRVLSIGSEPAGAAKQSTASDQRG